MPLIQWIMNNLSDSTSPEYDYNLEGTLFLSGQFPYSIQLLYSATGTIQVSGDVQIYTKWNIGPHVSFRFKPGDVVYDCLARNLIVVGAFYKNKKIIYKLFYQGYEFELEENCLFTTPPDIILSDELSKLQNIIPDLDPESGLTVIGSEPSESRIIIAKNDAIAQAILLGQITPNNDPESGITSVGEKPCIITFKDISNKKNRLQSIVPDSDPDSGLTIIGSEPSVSKIIIAKDAATKKTIFLQQINPDNDPSSGITSVSGKPCKINYKDISNKINDLQIDPDSDPETGVSGIDVKADATNLNIIKKRIDEILSRLR